MPMARRS